MITGINHITLKVDLHLEKLWSQNISITTRLVDTVTTSMLLKTIRSKKINPKQLISLLSTLKLRVLFQKKMAILSKQLQRATDVLTHLLCEHQQHARQRRVMYRLNNS